MAYALALESNTEIDHKRMHRAFAPISKWIKSFFPARVEARTIQFNPQFAITLITMPEPGIFFSKNKTGRRITMKRWQTILKKYRISQYLLGKSLQEYIKGGWSLQQNARTKRLFDKVSLLFNIYPLNGLNTETMTLALSGAEKVLWSPAFENLLKGFSLVNVLEEGNPVDDRWEEFMTETGIPVCRTNDEKVLLRSDVWLKFQAFSAMSPFNGVKVDIPSQKIVFGKTKKQFRIGFALPNTIVQKLGSAVIRRLSQDTLSCFLVDCYLKDRNVSLDRAEEELGVKLNIIQERITY